MSFLWYFIPLSNRQTQAYMLLEQSNATLKVSSYSTSNFNCIVDEILLHFMQKSVTGRGNKLKTTTTEKLDWSNCTGTKQKERMNGWWINYCSFSSTLNDFVENIFHSWSFIFSIHSVEHIYVTKNGLTYTNISLSEINFDEKVKSLTKCITISDIMYGIYNVVQNQFWNILLTHDRWFNWIRLFECKR